MSKLTDFTEVAVVEILFGDLTDEIAQQGLILWQNGPEQAELPIL